MTRGAPSALVSAWGLFQRALSVAALAFTVVACLSLGGGCRAFDPHGVPSSSDGWTRRTVTMEVTGYDSGPRSCNWKRDWLLRPVVASGPNKGKRKAVGITASGTKARRGTAAADTKYYPFGTVLYVKGYGWARVEDRGGAIKGPEKLDLWFSTEREARLWGRRKVAVTVWTRDR